MAKGEISEIINYYVQTVSEEAKGALSEFFGMNTDEVMAKNLLDHEDLNGMFHEWFIFHFELASGKTPIEEFCDTNPLRLTASDLQVFLDLRDENEYGLFSIISSKPGRVEVESLKNKKIYIVKEYTAAQDIVPCNVIVSRVAMAEKRYYFKSDKVRVVADSDGDEVADFKKKVGKRALTPKVMYQLWYKESIDNKPEKDLLRDFENHPTDKDLTLSEAEKAALSAFRRCDISPFISLSQVKQWVFNDEKLDSALFPMSLILGLASQDAEKEDVGALVRSVMDFVNHLPRRTLRGKCSVDASIDREAKQKEPKYRQKMIEPFRWKKWVESAHQAMTKGDIKSALKFYDQCFEDLLDLLTTDREVYRIFANKGTTMLAEGNDTGIYFLEMALDLNPRYDFAKKQLKRYKKGEFDMNIARFAVRELKKKSIRSKDFLRNLYKDDDDFRDDPAVKYYNWLKELGVDFSKHKIPKTTIFYKKIR
jgi:hypothetical protein